MPAPLSHLPAGRIVSVDAFRGLTFVLMLIVNFLAGASAIPPGIHHVGAEVDGMGLADVVFPAFLFAVGMSLPFAINGRLAKGDDLPALQRHIALRAAALIVMGLFMVNAESGYSESAMGMPIAAWSLAFYVAVGLTWGAFRVANAALDRTLRGAGIALLLVLAASYRAEGGGWMTTQWWGILGCIGWAYLAASIVYQLARANTVLLAAAIALCVLVFVASDVFDAAHVIAMHATHTSIVVAGTLCALIFFDIKTPAAPASRLMRALSAALLLGLAGAMLHQAYPVSKIGGTPPWALYCAALCSAAFALLYWLTDVRQARAWSAIVEPAATSPLVTYLIPFFLAALMTLLQLQWHPALVHGAGALIFSVLFSFGVVAVVAQLNKFNFKLRL